MNSFIFKVTTTFFLAGLMFNLKAQVFPGADEKTPSRAQYFSWINNLNEGATEEHTRINLDFFKWLKDEYGMQLDIYAYDAGAIDGAKFYGSIYSERFKKQFPNGFEPNYKQAKAMGTRLGVWGGPDGFGDTPEQAKARTDEMVKLCRDYEFALFKYDAVCGPLRLDKEDIFINMMEECRKYSPDLILLNHRLGLKKSKPYATTFLWEGQETYIDIHITNPHTAPHHRAGALGRGLPPQMKRLTEDHGVCISSCIDNWDDDLILQAFNRNLILAPEIYGNPWLMRDDEFPKLARIYNLHRKYRNIMQDVVVKMPEADYGPHAVSRGNGKTQLVSLRNLTWEPVTYKVNLNEIIGLKGKGKVHVRKFHPNEEILGDFNYGESVEVTVAPFRAYLLMATTDNCDEPGVEGCAYELTQNVEGKPISIKLLGKPGTEAEIKLVGKYKNASINGESQPTLAAGKKLKVAFEGTKTSLPYHRKVATLSPAEVPADAETLYEATCFAADNNALEIRSYERAGETKVAQVQAARDAFINQKVLKEKGLWDKHLFDNDKNTSFFPTKRKGLDHRVKEGCFRLDLGELTHVDYITMEVPDNFSLLPLEQEEGFFVEVSKDLKSWETITAMAYLNIEIPVNAEMRYLRMQVAPSRISEVKAYKNNKELSRKKWRASNLFAYPNAMPAQKAWSANFVANEIHDDSYLCVAVNGNHGYEGVYCALRVDGKLVGANDRAVSFASNVWENSLAYMDSNYTYYFPLNKEFEGKTVEVVALGYYENLTELDIKVWQTAPSAPTSTKKLVLSRR